MYCSQRRHRGPGVGALLLLSLACATYQPFDDQGHLRDRYAERLGVDAAGVEVPYELDEEILAEVEARINPGLSERQRTNRILDFVFGWLDLSYSLTPTRNAVETYHAREGNCLSFVNLFVGVARAQRLNPIYVEVNDLQKWNYRDGVVVSQGHIVAGLYLDGELSTFDFLPYRPKSYRNFKPIDDLAAAAHYYNNLGAEALLDGRVDRADELLSIAVRLAPDFDKAVNNKGVVLMRLGRTADAIETYRRALEFAPGNVALLSNMARALQQVGETERAAEYLGRVEETNQTSPYFFVYRGELELANGNTAAALDYMRRALKRDNEIPEVHLGLVKVYLATGDLEKVQHHLQRALRLDATHREARQLAQMLQAARGSGPGMEETAPSTMSGWKE